MTTKRFVYRIACAFVLVLGLSGGDAAAALIEPTVLVDGRVRDIDGTSFGPVTAADFEVFRNSSGFITNSIIEVDILGTGPIAGATVSFIGFPGTNNVSVYGYEGDGGLSTDDGLELANLLGTDDISGDDSMTLSTTFINSLITGGATTLGFNITGNNLTDVVGSIDDITITFETVPEPATLALYGLGLAGLGFARRRKAA